MDTLEKQLNEAEVGKVTARTPLSRHTTLKVGGPADLMVVPKSIEDAQMTLELVRRAGVPWRVIGRGSNLLIDDAGIEGGCY